MRFKDFHSSNRVLILDFGSHLIQHLTGKIREQGYLCEVHPYDLAFSEIKKFNPAGIILSGSSLLPADFETDQILKVEKRLNSKVYDLGVPVLGICYGMELMVDHFGGKIEAGSEREVGISQVAASSSKLFDGLQDVINVWMNHTNQVTKVPTEFKQIATDSGSAVAIEHRTKPLYGVLFHPEGPTSEGNLIIDNFLKICQVYADPLKTSSDNFFINKQTYRT